MNDYIVICNTATFETKPDGTSEMVELKRGTRFAYMDQDEKNVRLRRIDDGRVVTYPAKDFDIIFEPSDDNDSVRWPKARKTDVLVKAHHFEPCVSIAGDIGKDFMGVGWYEFHDHLWLFMSTKPDRSCYVWGYITLVEDGWMASVHKDSKVFGTYINAMRAVENQVTYEMSRI